MPQSDLDGSSTPMLLALVGATDGVQYLLQASKQSPQLVSTAQITVVSDQGTPVDPDTWLAERYQLLRCQMEVQLKMFGIEVILYL